MSNNKTIVVIIGLILVAAAFYGGMKYEQGKVPTSAFARGTGAFAGRGLRGMGGAGGFSGGQIIAKDATSITVSIPTGGSKIIFLSASTTVMKTSSGTVNDLTVGEQITANGSANSDGSITAQSIQIRPAGMQARGN